MNRRYTIIVNYDCKQYIENIYANDQSEAYSRACSIGSVLTNGGNTGWLQSCCAKHGWRGDTLGVVHDPRVKEEPEFPISEKELQVLNLIEQGVSKDAAEAIVYGPTDESYYPDLEIATDYYEE